MDVDATDLDDLSGHCIHLNGIEGQLSMNNEARAGENLALSTRDLSWEMWQTTMDPENAPNIRTWIFHLLGFVGNQQRVFPAVFGVPYDLRSWLDPPYLLVGVGVVAGGGGGPSTHLFWNSGTGILI